MGLQVVPAYIGEALFANPVENDRAILASLFQRTGLIRPGHLAVTPTGTARQVSVAAGRAFLLGTETSTQGGYHIWSDGADTYTFAAAVGNPRIDTLISRAVDEQYGVDPGISRAEIEIVQGISAASPVARADSYFASPNAGYKPGAWYRLADVRINTVDGVLPAGQITQTLQYARTGGRTICTSATRPTDPALGDEIFETDTTFSKRWTGAAWFTYAQSAWTTYTPAVTASAGAFALGNGTMTARYLEIGKTVTLNWKIILGTTTNFGTVGAYLIIPLPSGHVTTDQFTGMFAAIDTGNLEYGGYAKILSGGSTVELFKPVSGRIANNSPYGPLDTDIYSFTITYERT